MLIGNKGSFAYGGSALPCDYKYTFTGDARSGAAITNIPTSYQLEPHVVDIMISSSGVANAVQFVQNSDNSVKGQVFLAANSTVIFSPFGEIVLGTGDYLKAVASAAGNIAVSTNTYWLGNF